MPGATHVADKGYEITGVSRKFRAVVMGAGDNKAVEAAAAGAACIGILQEEVSAEDAANGRVAAVRTMGISRAVVDAAYARGTRLRAAADGRLTAMAAATANQNQVAILLNTSTAANDQVNVQLTIGESAST